METRRYDIDHPLRVFEAFAGYGSQSLAFKYLQDKHPDFAFKVVGFSEIDSTAMQAYWLLHGRDIPNYGDISRIDWDQVPDFDFISWSSPCFVAGTLVNTDHGIKNIEDVSCEDKALTHTNRYMSVVKPMKRKYIGNIVTIDAMMSGKIQCTERHPFYVRTMKRVGHKCKRTFTEPSWIQAKDLTKKHYLGFAINKESEMPKWDGVTIGRWNHQTNTLLDRFSDVNFWYLMGRYVGDGWKRSGNGSHSILICCSDRNEDKLKLCIEELRFNYCISSERTVNKYTISSKELSEFVSRYGYKAHGKKIDMETINLPIHLLKGFLQGYIDSDGCCIKDINLYKITTTSKLLAYGITQCIAKCHHCPVRVYFSERPKSSVIEGRVVNQHDTYQIVWHTDVRKHDHAFFEDGYVWFPIRSISQSYEDCYVYNMEVEYDHSYTANGAIVHNCQDFSMAGLRRGGEEGSGTRSSLIWEERRMIEAKHPKYIMLENVKGLLTEKMRPYFFRYLQDLESFGYHNFYKVLNASDYGIPQNRERIFVISILATEEDPTPCYNFPSPIPLEKTVEDVVEDDVPDKYYISKELMEKFLKQMDIDEYIEENSDT